jgi:hypothetical protein
VDIIFGLINKQNIKLSYLKKYYLLVINNLLYSIFENKEIVEYWLATTGLSLFSNKLESFYIHTGSGG